MKTFQYLLSSPPSQILFIFLMMFFFAFGSHYATYRHCRRVGQKWSFFFGFVSFLPKFNLTEWGILAASYIAALISFGLALRAG